METRVCKVCNEKKPLSDFHKNGKDKHGQPAWRLDCKECYTIVRKVNRKKLNKFINNTKHRTGEIATLTVRDWRDAMLWFRGGCAYCAVKQSRRLKLTKDHIVPVVKGGLTERKNIIPGCTRCNSSKSDRNLDEWYPRQPFYSEERHERIKEWYNGNT